MSEIPDGVALAWYGDDFTGAAAVMEVLTFAGLPSVLFLDPPGLEALARFPEARAVGLAGDARTRGPDWMRARLPAIFAALAALAPMLHYKVCSTLDSAPHVGSIGVAAEIGLADGGWAPVLVAAPAIGRWQAFGTLFARSPEGVARLDRHPTMRVHPVTPMDEADVRLHLARQTTLGIGLVDLAELGVGQGAAALARELGRGARLVTLDVVDDATLAAAGQLIWEQGARFVVGSQGVEYALVAAWCAAGLIAAPPPLPPLGRVERIAVVSGSASPVTAAQIEAAAHAGFEILSIDAAKAADPAGWARECARAAERALAALAAGRSPLVATARGPEDPALGAAAAAREAADLDAETFNARIGTGLGDVLDQVLRMARLPRAVIMGGDTSSHAARALGLEALTAATALAPGAPVLRGHSADPARDGIELVLKGGQMGPPDILARVRDGAGQGGAAAA